MNNLLIEAIGNKKNQDIYILGKGSTIDEINLNALEDNIVINTNDTELLLPGNICVFHHGWVLDVLEQKGPQANLYISDRSVTGATSSILAEYIPNNPDNSEFLLNRFYSSDIHVESSVLITALKVANLLAKELGQKKNVYLLGFDFTVKTGFTDQMPIHMNESESEYVEKTLKSQEHLLEMLLSEPEKLDISIKHVGIRPYSSFTVEAFNKLFNTLSYEDTTVLNSNVKDKFSVKVIAEITTNHFGDRERLRSMIIASKQAGADYIKLQKRDVETFYTKEKLDSEYRSPFGNTFRDYRHGIELSYDDFVFVDEFCKSIGIGWFASVLDYPSYLFMKQFDPEMVKLPSTISEHTEFLEAVAKDFKKDVVISTGFTHPEYESFILETFKNVRNVYLLQCTSAYPTANEATQLGVIRHYYNISREHANIIPGFSSHDIGSLCSMMAVAAGARMIEKHVKFGDVSWSHFDEVAVDLVNGDYAKVVSDIRIAEKIVGSETKEVHSTEHHKYWVSK
ncbi:MAG: N-acetylneuraminate synthase [Cobetia sp.]|uniref:N-acetylneuraminate synthase family protein n=1 Tax=Cobetia sp. TaxID=1873876 RepID=UPI000C498570|nr:N-acetylneuraminate synthase family protein [Cobetia sp.]MBF09334.1 N-acetylneuraminate synthase [Cobetia sp.]|tara:strand:+ start:13276 stop:14808 length:1533 start_codon:yes stop_codon:yes gene_type:complete